MHDGGIQDGGNQSIRCSANQLFQAQCACAAHYYPSLQQPYCPAIVFAACAGFPVLLKKAGQ